MKLTTEEKLTKYMEENQELAVKKPYEAILGLRTIVNEDKRNGEYLESFLVSDMRKLKNGEYTWSGSFIPTSRIKGEEDFEY